MTDELHPQHDPRTGDLTGYGQGEASEVAARLRPKPDGGLIGTDGEWYWLPEPIQKLLHSLAHNLESGVAEGDEWDASPEQAAAITRFGRAARIPAEGQPADTPPDAAPPNPTLEEWREALSDDGAADVAPERCSMAEQQVNCPKCGSPDPRIELGTRKNPCRDPFHTKLPERDTGRRLRQESADRIRELEQAIRDHAEAKWWVSVADFDLYAHLPDKEEKPDQRWTCELCALEGVLLRYLTVEELEAEGLDYLAERARIDQALYPGQSNGS